MAPLNPSNVRQVKTLSSGTELLCVARVPGAWQLWAGGKDGKLYHVDLGADKPQPQTLEGHTSYISGVVLTEKYVVSGGWDKRLIWWDRESRKQVRTIDAHQRWIRQLAITPDGQTIASIADDLVCRLWDNSGKPIRDLKGHAEKLPNHFPNKLYACAISSDGKLLATGDFLGHVVVWDIGTGKQEAAIDAPVFVNPREHLLGWSGLRALAFAPNGKHLALAGMQNTDPYITAGKALVRIYDWKTGQQTHEFKTGDGAQFETILFSPQGDWLAAGTGNGKALLVFCDLAKKQVIKEIALPTNLFGLVLDEPSATLVGVGKQIVQWELKG